ncbi:MAG TPA: zonular occludens toxin domain-containing protein, partial [Cellvibrio sp.]
MTTAIIHGDPGSYKTSTLISDYLVPAVKQGRHIVTNIRGVKTVDEIAEIYGFELPDTSQITLVDFNEAGFERMARFFHWAPEGALILMDEGQRVYPTRLRDFKDYDLRNPTDDKRPRTVEDAFDSHR